MHERQQGGPEAVFHDFAGFALHRPVQDRQGILLHLDDFGQKTHHPLPGLGLIPLHTRQKLRMEETYSLPGMTRSKLWASRGSSLMPRSSKAFLKKG